MPIFGAALRAELTKAVGIKSLRKELRVVARELKSIRTLLRAHPGPGSSPLSGRTSSPAIPAAKVRALRSDFGESRKAFAKRLGVSSSIVYLWESGRSSPTRPAIVNRLQALIASGPPSRGNGQGTPATHTPGQAHAKGSPKLSPQRRSALKLQGQYMGHLRNLKERQKAQVKALRTAKGYPAAISLARKLAKS